MPSTPDLTAVLHETRQFPELFQSLHLATSNARGEPEASYAAYVQRDGAYYVYTSELSTHTSNLSQTGRCSILFIESEADAAHLFARRRLTLQCRASECPRGGAQFELTMDLFAERFGNFMGMLRRLKDFHLFRLEPISGAYVAGFAKAYTLSGAGLSEITHRQEQGHSTPDERTRSAMDTLAS